MGFVHLHLHSHYSMLDGACTAKGLVKLCQENNMPGCAVTDHGYMGGVEELNRVFNENGLNGIGGCEVYVAPGSRLDKNPATEHVKGFHLVLLCENNTGYFNLCKLISEAYRTGIYYKPRIDKELLHKYHDGLIAMSACIAGEIPRRILDGNMDKARAALEEYKDIFGKDNFFIELMDHGIPEEKQVRPQLISLAREYGLGLVATNDAHYMKKEDWEAHDVMLCINSGAKLSDEKRFRMEPHGAYYFKTEAEMRELFSDVPEAVDNTGIIAERCKITFDYKANHYPVFYLPDGSVPTGETLRNICYDNMPDRYGFDPRSKTEFTEAEKKVLDRMEYELGIIERTKFCSYFMVVSDFIRYGKDHGVPVGPGRGSGAGSIVAFLMRITDIDPLRYDLLFERFLNPERVSPPDFDVDFCEKRRSEVIEYVRQKYGYDNVAQICTYGQLKPKAVVKDVARVLGLSFEDGNRLTKMIPDDLKITIDKAIEQSEDLKKAMEEDPQVAEVIRLAKPLEGLNRQTGVHAAGVIIGDQRLDNLVPLSHSATGDMVVQYPKGPCEALGLLKMDFLGLRTLTIIRNALDMIKEQHGIDINLSKLPLDDQKTFEMLRRGDTIAVFQLESTGMQALCRNFGVETVEHIIALVALYRPGPMQFMDEFIKRKKGTFPIEYDHPKMEPILKETYGIMLYQEQIMQVVQALAGFSLGGADMLRRAIGKKKVDVMLAQHDKFVKGCADANNIPEAIAETIWEKIKLFAGYGFNKSHSAAYGIVTYQTAYLKANYPVEFMAAVMTGEIENAEKLAFFINACREMGIAVLPPDVNSSNISFSVDHGKIRFGLGAIKGVGGVAAGKIIESRKKDGVFKDFADFCERCGTDINSRMLEYMIRAGALDCMKLKRSQLIATKDEMLACAASAAKDKAAGQGSLFDMLDPGESGGINVVIPDIPEFEWSEILKSEKELLGFYVSGHPLDPESKILHSYAVPLHDVASYADGAAIRVAGMISNYTVKFGKTSGKQFGVMQLEDLDATMEIMFYERAMDKMAKAGIVPLPETNVLLEVSVSKRDPEEPPRLLVNDVQPLDKAPELYTETLFIYLKNDAQLPLQQKEIAAAYDALEEGKTKVIIGLLEPDDSVVYVECRREVTITREFLKLLEKFNGPKAYRVNVIPPRAPMRKWTPKDKPAEQPAAGK